MKKIVCVARFKAQTDKLDDLVYSLKSLNFPTFKEPGCIQYELYYELGYHTVSREVWDICYIAKWRSIKDYEKHCNNVYIKHFYNETAKLLVEASDIRIFSSYN